jgi:hypothetical protein
MLRDLDGARIGCYGKHAVGRAEVDADTHMKPSNAMLGIAAGQAEHDIFCLQVEGPSNFEASQHL